MVRIYVIVPNSSSSNISIILVYFDATGACHELAFAFGPTGVGNTIPTRTFSIKVIDFLEYYRVYTMLIFFRLLNILVDTTIWPLQAATSTFMEIQRLAL